MSPVDKARRMRREAAECRERIANGSAHADDDRRARELDARATRLEMREARARLIAAAPDLLEAALTALDCHDLTSPHHEDWNRAKNALCAAIEKATGGAP